MGFLHAVDCLLVLLGTPVIIYRSSKLHEIEAIFSVLYAMGAYLLCQIVKMVLLATVITGEEEEIVAYSIWEDLADLLVGGIDVFALYYTLELRSVRGIQNASLRILAVSLGWSLADSILKRLLPVLMGAWGTEFNAAHIVSSVESAILVPSFIGFVSVVWLLTRNNLNHRLRVGCIVLIVIYTIVPHALKSASYLLEYSLITGLILKTVISVGLGAISFAAFQIHQKSMNK